MGVNGVTFLHVSRTDPYASTQGGEADRFEHPDIFESAIKPFDLIIMNEINQTCQFNILHICDYVLPYDDFSRFRDYPGHVVNLPLSTAKGQITMQKAVEMFNRPYMGGLDRLGILATGTPEQAKQATEAVLRDAPERFILGADCTVPSETAWDNLKIAIDTAHSWER